MKLFIGSLSRLLLQTALEMLGEPAPLMVLPASAENLPVRLPNLTSITWHQLWHSLDAELPPDSITAAHLTACAEVCQQMLSDSDYFGEVRRSPRFHRQLMERFVEWRRDGLTPERLEQAADAICQPPWDSIAGLDAPELRDEWRRKAGELCMLWREWEQVLEARALPNPGANGWILRERLRQRRPTLPPRLLLWGFDDLRTVDIELLRALERQGCEVNLALLNGSIALERLQPLLDEAPIQVGEPSPAPSANLTLLSAADPLREAEAVARQVLSHLQRGVAPEQMLILVRHPASVAERLNLIFERYGIPLALEAPLPLSASPLVRVMLDALRLLAGDGVGTDWLEWLKNPYLGWSRERSYRLTQLRRQARPADEWLDMTRQHDGMEPAVRTLLDQLAELRDRLRSPSADLVGVLTALAQSLAPEATDLTARNDLTALNALLELTRAYMPLLRALSPASAVAQLAWICQSETYMHAWGRRGVRVLPLEAVPLLQAEIVFIMELIEGVLPRRQPDDPFLRESERRALRDFFRSQLAGATHVSPLPPVLPLRSERQRLEPLLFRAPVACATQQLYLSYPRTMDNSETLPSSYLQRLLSTSDAESTITTRFYRLEELVPPEEEQLHPYDRLLASALEAAPAAMPDAADRLTLPRTRQRVMNIDRVFSVSELETLHRCPFQHLFRHQLRVRVPQRGLQLSQIGRVVHSALRHAYRQHRSLAPDSPEWARALIDSLQRVLASEPLELTHWQLQVLDAYATRLLNLFAQREARYRRQFGLEPRHFEWAFGTPADGDEENPLTPSPDHYDPDSITGALRLPLGDGQSVRVSGVVDRIDFSPDGAVAMITDYKLTRSPHRKELEAGEAFQPLLYLLTVRARYTPQRVVIAFDELSRGRRVRFVPYDEALIRRFRAGEWEGSPAEIMAVLPDRRLEQAISQLREELRHLLTLLQNAIVAPTPGSHCRLCAFGDLCRKAQR